MMSDRIDPLAAATRRIEELAQRLKAVEAERDDYRLVFDRAPLLIWYKDDRNNVLRANAPAAATAGLTPDEVAHRSAYELYPEEAEGYYQDDLEVIRSGRPKLGIVEQLDTPGGKRWVQTDKLPWSQPDQGTTGVLVFVSDITDRMRMQEELFKVQHLESLGTLASGIAHDFNNLLTSIYGNVELLRSRLTPAAAADPDPTAERAERYVARATASIERARSLTRQLVSFARGGEPGRRPVDLTLLVEEVVALTLSGSALRCETEIEPDLPAGLGDRGQIAQILENLLLNALQAMQGAPSATCRVRARSCLDPLPSFPGAWIELTVEDRGPGVPAEHLPFIFDPFYTTKPAGSGLGLSSAYSIARRHGGTLDCWNNPDGGATFRLLLPVATGPAESPPATAAPRPAKQAQLRVLLLDDDAAIREFARAAGPDAGLEIECAGELSQALRSCARAAEAGHPYDAVVIDLTLRGGGGGLDALEALRGVQPGLPAVVCSGYPHDPALLSPRELGFDAALEKPYLIAELRRALLEATSPH